MSSHPIWVTDLARSLLQWGQHHLWSQDPVQILSGQSFNHREKCSWTRCYLMVELARKLSIWQKSSRRGGGSICHLLLFFTHSLLTHSTSPINQPVSQNQTGTETAPSLSVVCVCVTEGGGGEYLSKVKEYLKNRASVMRSAWRRGNREGIRMVWLWEKV